MAITKTDFTFTDQFGLTNTGTILDGQLPNGGFHEQLRVQTSGVTTDGNNVQVDGTFFYNIEQNGGGFHSASHATEHDVFPDGSTFNVVGSNAGNDIHLDSHVVVTETAPDGTVTRMIATESEYRPGYEDRPHNLVIILGSSDGTHDVTHIHTGPGDGWIV